LVIMSLKDTIWNLLPPGNSFRREDCYMYSRTSFENERRAEVEWHVQHEVGLKGIKEQSNNRWASCLKKTSQFH
jgi:hypothetical protein